MSNLLGLLSSGAEISRGAASSSVSEVAGEDWLEEGAKDDLGAAVTLVSMHSITSAKHKAYLVAGSAIHSTSTNLNV